MTRLIYNFDQLTAQATRTKACPVCGKKTRRSRTFSQTVNPRNTTEEDGQKRPKTHREVQQAVNDQAALWYPADDVFRHAKCGATS